jgi:hypothetical protein
MLVTDAGADLMPLDPPRPADAGGDVGPPTDEADLADDAGVPPGEPPSVSADAVPGAEMIAAPNPAPIAPTCNHRNTPKLRARSRRGKIAGALVLEAIGNLISE